MKNTFAAVVVSSLAALALACPAAALATDAPQHLALGDAVAEALKANPGLKALSHQHAAAGHSAKAAARTRWGQLDGIFSYARSNDGWLVRPMSRELFEEAGGFEGLPWDRNQQHYGLTFAVPLYLGGALKSGIEIAELEAAKAAALVEGTRWHLRFNATSLYTAAQTLDAVTVALDELVLSLEETSERLDLMVKVGKRPELDRLKVVEQLEDARAERASLGADRIKVGALLLALMGRDPSARIVVDPLPERMPAFALPLAEIRAGMASSSLLRQAQLDAEQSRRHVAAATAGFLPQVVANGNYLRNVAPSLSDSLDTWQVSVAVKLPLFHGNSRSRTLAAARERRSAAERGVEQARLDLAAGLEEALARFDSSQAELVAAQARVAAGNETARVEQIRYDTGAGTIEDLLRAQARKESSRASLARARGDITTAAVRINSIVEKRVVK